MPWCGRCENAEEAGKGKAVSTTIIGAGFAGALLIVLSVIELSPHLCGVCCNRSQLEVKVGKIVSDPSSFPVVQLGQSDSFVVPARVHHVHLTLR